MKAAMIGDNCIDVYRFINGKALNRRYPTGNVVDTGVNLRKLGVPTAIISTTGSDDNGRSPQRSGAASYRHPACTEGRGCAALCSGGESAYPGPRL